MSGWIKLHRKLLKWEWYHDTNCVRVFTHLLLTVNHKPSRFAGHDVPAGARVTGYPSLAKEVRLSVRQVRVVFDKLRLTGELTVKSTPKFSIVSITNWSDFQEDDRQTVTQMTGERQANDRPVTTSKECKNNIPPYSPPKGTADKPPKNSSSKSITVPKPDGVDDSVWHDFLALRKQKRAPLSETALNGIAKQADLADVSLNEALSICCERGWQSFKADWVKNEKPGAQIFRLSDRSIPAFKRFGPI